MHLPPGVPRRAAAALAATTVIVMASVGSCQMPQPKFPSLGLAAPPASADGFAHAPRPPLSRVQ